MKKAELALLEKLFTAEVNCALSKGVSHLVQDRSKLAKSMTEGGFIRKNKTVLGGRFPVTIEGYELTELGRFVYCLNC